MPLFSVIIPVYNVEKYLARCLDSLLNQDFKDYELVLIDDGSKDTSGQICDDYAKKYNNIIVIHHENRGVSLSREVGVNASHGEYLLFVDSDDSVREDYFEVLKNYTKYDIIRFGNSNIKQGKVCEGFTFKERGIFTKEMIEKVIYPYLIQDVHNGYYRPSLWCHAIKRDLFIKNMLVGKKIRIGEDGACVIPCVYHAESMVFIEDPLYNYYFNDDSVTRSKRIYDWNYPEMIVNHLAEKMDLTLYDFPAQVDRKIVHELFHVVKSQFYLPKKTKEIKLEIKKNLDETPLYKESIQRARFKSFSGRLLAYALRHRMLFLFKLISKIR